MKKIIFKTTVLLAFVVNTANAQWNQQTLNQVTNDDIGIGIAMPTVPNSKLFITSGFNITGGVLWNPSSTGLGGGGNMPPTPLPCTLVGKPALSINWVPLNGPQAMSPNQQLCSNVITKPNAFEIYGTDISSSPPFGQLIKYAVQVNHAGAIGLNGSVDENYNTTINGNTGFKNNVHIKNKLRISNVASFNNSSWSNANFPYSFSVDNGDSRFMGKVEISSDTKILGSLRIGTAASTAPANYRLSVDGDIVSKRNVVQTLGWADYVFAQDYNLMPLNELDLYIKANNHLPAMPCEQTIINNGQDLGEIQKLQQAKIEELTLYIIQLKKDLDDLRLSIKN